MNTKSSGVTAGNGLAKRGPGPSHDSSERDDSSGKSDRGNEAGAEDESTASDADQTTGGDDPQKRGGTKERTSRSH